MRLKITPVILLTITIIALSCNHNNDDDPAIEKKKSQLTDALLLHYNLPQDSSKQKAALFLVENMAYRYHLPKQAIAAHTEIINAHYKTANVLIEKLDSLKQIGIQQKLESDILTISNEYLIKNIDLAFLAFNKAAWRNKISFNDFCEYILPYCIGMEPIENWREDILGSNAYLDTLWDQQDLPAACLEINKHLAIVKRGYIGRFGDNDIGLPDLPYAVLRLLPAGSCKDISNYGLFAMRTAGLPVAMDFSPQHANYTGSHEWVALIIDSIQSIPFDIPVTGTLGTYKSPDVKNPKIYRTTFSVNTSAHPIKRGYCAFLPSWLNNPHIKDVTDNYMPVSRVNIPLPEHNQEEFIYLSCFDNKSWIPVSWTIIHDKHAIFEKTGREVVYLPEYINENGRVPASEPFLLDKDGAVISLKADLNNLQSLKLTRKFPFQSWVLWYQKSMIGGQFQGANKKDFSDAVCLHRIDTAPADSTATVSVETNKKFKYLRYLAPFPMRGNIAELEFYSLQSGKEPLKGNIIGTEGSENNIPEREREAVFDGNVLTYFYANKDTNNWVGIALEKPQKIDKIRYNARTDNNGIVAGNVYELFYWGGKGRWVPAGRQVAARHTLTFDGVPSNALFLLRNHTEGKEERIFTYKNGEQIWW